MILSRVGGNRERREGELWNSHSTNKYDVRGKGLERTEVDD